MTFRNPGVIIVGTADTPVISVEAGVQMGLKVTPSNSTAAERTLTLTVTDYSTGTPIDFPIILPAKYSDPTPFTFSLEPGDSMTARADAVGVRLAVAGADVATVTGSAALVPKGTYAAGTTYAKNEIVSLNGTSYISLVDSNVGNDPATATAYWMVLAAKGTAGTPGANGTGNVNGPGVSVLHHVAAFANTAGTLLEDAGIVLGSAASKNTGTSAGQVPLLDGTGKLDTSILPALALTEVFVVGSQAAMLALTAQMGDVAIRTDVNQTYILATNSPTTLADWKLLPTPTDLVLSVAGLVGAISASALKTALAIAVADITDASANGRSLISAANYAAMKSLLAITESDVAGLTADLAAKEPATTLNGLNTQTASYTFVLTDAGKLVELNNASANNATVPPNSSVAFPLNTRIDLVQYGAGQTTVAAGAGVTIRAAGGKLKLSAQYSGASLYKRATDEWVLIGDLTT